MPPAESKRIICAPWSRSIASSHIFSFILSMPKKIVPSLMVLSLLLAACGTATPPENSDGFDDETGSVEDAATSSDSSASEESAQSAPAADAGNDDGLTVDTRTI